MSAGTTLSMNSSSDAALTSWSIVRVSSGLGPMWRATKRSAGSREARAVAMVERLFANLRLGLLAPQEVVEFLRTRRSDPGHACTGVGGRVLVRSPLPRQSAFNSLRTLSPNPDHPTPAEGFPFPKGRSTADARVNLGHGAGEGEKDPETAFTASIVPNTSMRANVAPTLGRST